MINTLSLPALQRNIEQQLLEYYHDATLCNQYSWWILEAITGTPISHLVLNNSIEFDNAQQQKLDEWLDKLINHNMPLQYLLGSTPFLELELLLETPILIPRPETEEMCDNLIEQLKKLKNKQLTVLDIGTGTGAIALSLAQALPQAQIYAVDVVQQALELARRNAEHNNITNVTFVHSDVFTNIPHGVTFDLIISNPPYIAPEEFESLDDSVVQWEDKTALVAQNNGLAIIERIIKQTPQFLRENAEMEAHNIPQLILEIGYLQGHAVSRLLENAGFDAITIKKDLEGKDRVAMGRVKHVAIHSQTE
jgi:release factor glutamine methyltransferase